MAKLAVDDGSIWYEDRGAGQPLIFLHGAWSNANAWDTQVEEFTGDYRVVRTDVRGHGRTGPTDRRRYSIELFADDLETLIADLDLDSPILCGLSMGNIIVQEYLNRHPAGATAAVLCGPARSLPPVDLPRSLKRLGPPPGLATSLGFAGSETIFRSLTRSIRAATGGPWIAADPGIRERAIEAAGEVETGEFRKIYRALYAYDPPTLSHVRAPTLAIYGQSESALVKRQGHIVAAEVEDGTIAAVEDAAHLVNLDNPTAFNERMAEFLESV